MAEKYNENYLETLSDELSLALGKAVWAFARIEKQMFEYMKQLSKDDLPNLIGYQPINKRIEIINKLIDKIEDLEVEKQEALYNIKQIIELSNSRNQIAHCPWVIWIDLEEEVFKTEIRDLQNTNKAPIDEKKIKVFTENAEKLASNLEISLIPLAKAVRGF